jgi:hypothetical protein
MVVSPHRGRYAACRPQRLRFHSAGEDKTRARRRLSDADLFKYRRPCGGFRRRNLFDERQAQHFHSQPVRELLQKDFLAVVEAYGVAIPERFGRQLDERDFLTRPYAELFPRLRRNPLHLQTGARRNADSRQRPLQIVVYQSSLIFNPAFESRLHARARRGRLFEVPQIGH